MVEGLVITDMGDLLEGDGGNAAKAE